MKKLFVLMLAFLLIFGCDVFNTTFEDSENAVMYEASTIVESEIPTNLKVMSWNIKFGGARIDFFFDGWGEEVLMDENLVIENMQAIADYIIQFDPDIVLLQEIDIDSKRSAYVDQLQYLLDETALNYGAYASQWKADFVPSDGIGRMNSGNAIMSKWQITDAERIALPLIEEQDDLTQYFYLRRNILKTKIELDEEELFVLNIHASAYSTDGTKQEQINIFKAEIDELDSAGSRFIAGGDFNAIPPNSVNIIGENFPDRPADLDEDFEVEDYDLDDMVAFYDDYSPAVPLENIALQEEVDNYISDYYTHSIYIDLPNIDWNRKLDYLFTNNTNGWIENSDITHQNTRELSDHCPISAEMEVVR